VSGLVDAGVAGMGAVLGEVLGCAVGIMISPIPIAAASHAVLRAGPHQRSVVRAGLAAGLATVVLLIPWLGASADDEASTTDESGSSGVLPRRLVR